MSRSLGLDKLVLPHELLDDALEEMIQYVEALHEVSLADAQRDKLRSLLVAAQEVVRERCAGYASKPEKHQEHARERRDACD